MIQEAVDVDCHEIAFHMDALCHALPCPALRLPCWVGSSVYSGNGVRLGAALGWQRAQGVEPQIVRLFTGRETQEVGSQTGKRLCSSRAKEEEPEGLYLQGSWKGLGREVVV